MDTANCIADVWFRLGFLNAADAAVDDRWVTIPELYQFGDDAVKLLARTSSLFLTYDASVAITGGTSTYATPASHIFTEGAWLSGPPVQLLRLSTVGQLFALDANWPAAAGIPSRLSLDAAGVGFEVLYPSPLAAGTLAGILEICPPTVTSAASTIPVSSIFQDYFSYAMLAGALGKESDSARPEIAAHAKERLALYGAVIEHLFGAGRLGP